MALVTFLAFEEYLALLTPEQADIVHLYNISMTPILRFLPQFYLVFVPVPMGP